jgi:hypothetical protein
MNWRSSSVDRPRIAADLIRLTGAAATITLNRRLFVVSIGAVHARHFLPRSQQL